MSDYELAKVCADIGFWLGVWRRRDCPQVYRIINKAPKAVQVKWAQALELQKLTYEDWVPDDVLSEKGHQKLNSSLMSFVLNDFDSGQTKKVFRDFCTHHRHKIFSILETKTYWDKGETPYESFLKKVNEAHGMRRTSAKKYQDIFDMVSRFFSYSINGNPSAATWHLFHDYLGMSDNKEGELFDVLRNRVTEMMFQDF